MSGFKLMILPGSDPEIEVEVEFDYTPETPDVWYLPNGDPGYPGTDAEVDVTSIKLFTKNRSGVTIRLEIIDYLLSDVIEALEEDILRFHSVLNGEGR